MSSLSENIHRFGHDSSSFPAVGISSGSRKNDRQWFAAKPSSGNRKCFYMALVCLTIVLSQSRSWADVVVVDPHSTVAGKTSGEWSAEQWKWSFSFSMPNDPFSDASGALANLNQSGPVFFVAGSFGDGPLRTFTVPTGKYLLFPLLVGELSQLEVGFDQSAA